MMSSSMIKGFTRHFLTHSSPVQGYVASVRETKRLR